MPTAQNGTTAHRGNSADFPENTLVAFADGIACGADWLELDVHLSADGHLVVCHDDRTGRTGDRDLVIAQTPLAELRAVDLSAGFRRAHPERATAPTRMPLLREVLELVLREQRARLSVQPKADCVPAVVELVRALKAEAWVGFNDGSLAKLRQARELLPGATVFYDTGPGGAPVEEHVAAAQHYRFDAIVMHDSGMTPAAARCIAAAGLEPGVWTVNDPADMRRFRALGVRRFYTDCPRVLLALPGVAAEPV
jgi:glycerophosphoryl diester phosphodiesterase